MELFAGQERARKEIAAKADAWTSETARRLGISPEAVLKAIERGWLPERIDRVRSAAELIGRPRA